MTVINLNRATKIVNHVTMDYDVYALFLKNGTNCTIKYGRRPYDYQEGPVVSFAPGQQVTVDTETDEVAPDVTGLMFQHPQHFSRMFKRVTGVSPTQFRKARG